MADKKVRIDRFCLRLISKSRGLMFSRPKNIALEFKKPKRIGLHTFFVFYPIDVLFLDETKRVVEIKKDFRPFRFYSSIAKAKYAIELGRERDFYRVGERIDF